MNGIRLLVIIGLLLGMSGQVRAQMDRDQTLSQFVSAGFAYKEERYEEAIEKYQSIVDNGWASGSLYYNLGNSYFKKDDLGRAVLNYERAKRLIPRDSDLKFNSRYADSKVSRFQEEREKGYLQKALQAHVEHYSFDEMAWIIFGLLAAIAAMHVISLYARWRPNMALSILCVLSVICAVFVVGLVSKCHYDQDRAVALSDSKALFEPRSDSTVHFNLSEGMRTRIMKSEGNWVKIERSDGKQGWVDKTVLERI